MASPTTPTQGTYGGLYTPPEYLLSKPGSRHPEWQILTDELEALRNHVGQLTYVSKTLAPDADFQGLDEARAGFDRLQLTVDGLRARGALRPAEPASLAERMCLSADESSVADEEELLCYFADFADVGTAADLRTHVLGAHEVRRAVGEYTGAQRIVPDVENREVAFEGCRPLPTPDAACFLAGLGEDRLAKLVETHRSAVDWDAVRCVARIVGYLESYACSAIPWSTLARPGPGREREGQEDEARERYAVGLRVFSYVRYHAVMDVLAEAVREDQVRKIEKWQEDIPEEAFLDPLAWTGEEAEVADLESRRQGIDLTAERQQTLLGALLHWDEIADSRKHGTKKDLLTKLKGMFSRRR
ncbi:hypothetical protein F4818DRAFT_436418 [Hypoxylon cercidicola]|nr:hypothetical protein F4818DRAFT_436418 [Hypoxylon cercidicola]